MHSCAGLEPCQVFVSIHYAGCAAEALFARFGPDNSERIERIERIDSLTSGFWAQH